MIIDGKSKTPPATEPTRYRMIRLAVVACVGLGLIAVILNWQRNNVSAPGEPGGPNARVAKSSTTGDVDELKHGEELARTLCASCHLFPEPDSLDRFTWGFEVLPSMAVWLGLTRFDYEGYPGGKRLEAAHVFPTSPALSFEDWRAICNYYVTTAPVTSPPQDPRAPINKMAQQFTPIVSAFYRSLPQTTLVKIDFAGHRIFVGDANTNSLNVINPEGKTLATITLESPPVSLTVNSNGLFVTSIGSFIPSDEPEGSLTLLATPKQGAGTKSKILDRLFRPVDVVVADVNQDGRDDLVVCQYGNIFGRFSWYENVGPNQYQEHVLIERPGAIKAYVADFNHDGRPDIVVLMAQAREGVYLFLNQGKGVFEQKTLLEQPPTWGYSGLQVVDFDGDGNLDLLTTNGDNGDIHEYRPPFKRYHGVRLYLNDGKNNFKEKYFYPLNGAYQAIAADFKGKGKLDIAAISFFPDYVNSPTESFVYLENQGNYRFAASTLSAALSGRWLTMDVGDLDGDGRPDIVLGAFNRGLGVVPKLLADQWEKKGATVLILKNNQK